MNKFLLNFVTFSVVFALSAASNDASPAATIGSAAVQQDETMNLRRNLKNGPKPKKEKNEKAANAPNPKGKAVAFYCCRPFRKEADQGSCGVVADYTPECQDVLSQEGVEFCGCTWTGDDCEEIECVGP